MGYGGNICIFELLKEASKSFVMDSKFIPIAQSC